MSQSTTSAETLFSPHASLAAIAARLNTYGVFDLIRQHVQIAQKTVKDSPQDKVIDILMTLLCGAQSKVQLNTLLRADPALQRSIGRARCCEQSVAQQTLDAATAQNVEQMQQVLTTLFREHSRATSHSFLRSSWLILDVDLTGMPCGKKAEHSTKGYFSQSRSGVLLFAGLAQKDLLRLMGMVGLTDEACIMRAHVHFYDQRGDGIETSFGEDKGGLGITKRNKKRFQAQRLLMLLGTLAHNLLIWSRRWLCRHAPTLAALLRQYGIKRMLRDLLQISGTLSFDRRGRLHVITLQPASSLAKLLQGPLHRLLALSHIAVILDKT